MQHGDLERLMALWSDDDEIACVHPGGQRLVGPEAVRTSFASMFRTGGVDAHAERVRRLQLADTSIHHVVERVQAPGGRGSQFALVVVTNVYVRDALGWRIVLHHASPHTARGVVVQGSPGGRPSLESEDSGDGPTTLH
jgi:ketosteroid isomerase-like protein